MFSVIARWAAILYGGNYRTDQSEDRRPAQSKLGGKGYATIAGLRERQPLRIRTVAATFLGGFSTVSRVCRGLCLKITHPI